MRERELETTGKIYYINDAMKYDALNTNKERWSLFSKRTKVVALFFFVYYTLPRRLVRISR